MDGMDGMDGLNRAMRYIEENLTADIDWNEAARLACCSEYHFRRLFSFLSGVSLSEYVRRRRLTLAAYELRQGGGRIVDVALKYGYESPDSFGRAFLAMHGFTPSEARAGDRPFAAFPRMTFQLTIRGGSEMKVRFVDKEAFRIVGFKRRVKLVYEGVNPEIAAMWSLLNEETIRRLKELSNVEPAGLVSASANFGDRRLETGSDDHGELDHCIGAATTRECPDGFDALEAAAGTWAVFEAVGPFPATLQNVWGRIYSEWFPSSGYELAEGPELLWNESKDTSLPDYRSEIWIPVKRSMDDSSM